MSCKDPGASLTTVDGSYFGNVFELVEGLDPRLDEVEEACALDGVVETEDEEGVVPVDVVLLPPHPATSNIARRVSTTSTTMPDPVILFTSMPLSSWNCPISGRYQHHDSSTTSVSTR